MKNELDRQLKAQWEAASVEDFDTPFDTEKLWHKIARPAQRQRGRLSWLKYVAALLIGAMVTLGLTHWNAPATLALRSGMSRQETRLKNMARQETKTSQVEVPEYQPQKQSATSGYIPTAAAPLKTGGTMPVKEAIKEEPIVPGDLKPVVPQDPGSIAQVSGKPKASRKTIHLLDLEKPAAPVPKPGKFMMAMEEHLRAKSEDIAISTKILTHQF